MFLDLSYHGDDPIIWIKIKLSNYYYYYFDNSNYVSYYTYEIFIYI